MNTLLDGTVVAAAIRDEVTADVARLRAGGVTPTLALVSATDDSSAAWYARMLVKAAEKAGITVVSTSLGSTATANDIRAALDRYATDPAVHGILLHTPLPAGVSIAEVASMIPPGKDVDGVNPTTAGRVFAGLPAFAPATASAVLAILDAHQVPLAGQHAVVVGRSLTVGIPVAHLLLARDATVTICHSRTRDLATLTRQADILVAAIGRPGFLGRDHVTPGATVIDVGTTPDQNGRLRGDVDADQLAEVAGALTPVPGGVGPVTTVILLANVVVAAVAQQEEMPVVA